MTLDAVDVQASEVAALSPWSMATTPERLWDTSSPTVTPASSVQGLSTAALSPGISPTTAALTITGLSTSTAQGLMDASAGLAPDLPAVTGKVGASAGRHYASSQQSLNAAPTRSRTRSRTFLGRPIAASFRADPHFPVPMLKQQQVGYWHQFFGFVSTVSFKEAICLYFLLASSNRRCRPNASQLLTVSCQ